MLSLLVVSLLSSLFYYVESFKSGLSAKKWALVGLLLGPMALPFFTISQHVKLRHAQGFGNSYLRA